MGEIWTAWEWQDRGIIHRDRLVSGMYFFDALQLFRFEDRKFAKYLLSPTHEEEITSLVSSTIKSYKELPLRLYQISSCSQCELIKTST